MSCLYLNKVVLAGRITAEPELKQTPNGTLVTSFTVAVNRKYTKEQNQQTDFINIVAWRQVAEFITRYFRKGSAICIIGSVQTRSWQDQHNQKRYATDVVADEAMFVDSKSENQTATPNDTHNQYQAIAAMNNKTDSDDDLPF